MRRANTSRSAFRPAQNNQCLRQCQCPAFCPLLTGVARGVERKPARGDIEREPVGPCVRNDN